MNKSICHISCRTVRPLCGNFLFLRILVTANYHPQKSCCGKNNIFDLYESSRAGCVGSKRKGVLQNENFTTRRTRNDGFECKFRRNLLQYLVCRPCMGRQIKLGGAVTILQQLLFSKRLVERKTGKRLRYTVWRPPASGSCLGCCTSLFRLSSLFCACRSCWAFFWVILL